MWCEAVFEQFVQEAPFAVMLRASLEHIWADASLDDVFAAHAQEQYCRELTFSAVTTMMAQVVLRVQPSLRRAYLRRQDVPVTLKAVYEKLQHVEPAVCQALVAHTAERCRAVLDAWPQAQRPDPVPGLRVRTVDGNFLAGTEHRLRPQRGDGAACLPGMAVVLRDDRTGLLPRLVCCEDAYTNERSLVDAILPWVEPDDLLLADRNYCTLDFLAGIAGRPAYFLVRHHQQLHLHPRGPQRYCGRTETGAVYEQAVDVGPAGQAQPLRCIVVQLDQPTQDGETEVVLLTNVPAAWADALVLADLYRRRWRLEQSFQELTDQLRCEVNTLAYPRAALFGFSLAVAAANVLAVLRGALAAVVGPAAVEEQLSTDAVAQEIASHTAGMRVALPAAGWRRFGRLSSAAMAAWLERVARGIRWRCYRKTTRGPKKPVPVKRRGRGAHRSTARVLREFRRHKSQ